MSGVLVVVVVITSASTSKQTRPVLVMSGVPGGARTMESTRYICVSFMLRIDRCVRKKFEQTA